MYKCVQLILKGSQGYTRNSRSISALNIEEQVTFCFKKFAPYLYTPLHTSVPEKFCGRFKWPEWLLLFETGFDFLLDIDEGVSHESFKDLLEI